ncbi:MAG: type I methionyl aminopeptidase [Candidatus Pacebacteria bacterium]|nr:type I methionyl aminopeptidase [Candidatus Paceibacterota bacterium]
MTLIKTEEEIKILREGGKRLAFIMAQLKKAVVVGISTKELDQLTEKLIRDGGDEPSILNYKPDGASYPFPASVCISINDEIVHGIPGERKLEDGDIVSFDFCLTHKKLITDGAITVLVGDVVPEIKKLVNVTKSALEVGIKVARPGKRLGDIGHAIEMCARQHGYGVIRELGGHGVGHCVHEEPFVQNFGKPGEGLLLEPGMVIALEPMFTLGSRNIEVLKDGYTIVTRDHSPSAHFEHTIAITKDGHKVLTAE